MAEIDHIVLGARTLAEGAAYVEQPWASSRGRAGVHAGTAPTTCCSAWGKTTYLEVIAPDP